MPEDSKLSEQNPVEIKTGGIFQLAEERKEGFREVDTRLLDKSVSARKFDEVYALQFRNLSADPNFGNKLGDVSCVASNLKFCLVDAVSDSAPIYVPIMRQTFCFAQQNVAASQINAALNILGSSDFTSYRSLYRGGIIGLVAEMNAAITGGSCTIEPTINGSGIGLTIVLSSSQSVASATQEANLDTFLAQAQIGCRITTTGTFAPTTADLLVTVYTS